MKACEKCMKVRGKSMKTHGKCMDNASKRRNVSTNAGRLVGPGVRKDAADAFKVLMVALLFHIRI
jgi:hypothetical protein